MNVWSSDRLGGVMACGGAFWRDPDWLPVPRDPDPPGPAPEKKPR